jgi:hypothetical protein
MARPLSILNEEDHALLLRLLKGDSVSSKEYRRIKHIIESSHRLRLKKGIDGVSLFLNSKEVILRHQKQRKLTVIQTFHDNRGHCGRDTTYENIRRFFYGINKEDVQSYLRNCEQCKYRQRWRE